MKKLLLAFILFSVLISFQNVSAVLRLGPDNTTGVYLLENRSGFDTSVSAYDERNNYTLDFSGSDVVWENASDFNVLNGSSLGFAGLNNNKAENTSFGYSSGNFALLNSTKTILIRYKTDDYTVAWDLFTVGSAGCNPGVCPQETGGGIQWHTWTTGGNCAAGEL